MPMTPDEYAARELNVPGYTDDEPIYAPDLDPNIQRLFAANAAAQQAEMASEPEPEPDPQTVDMAFEYNFTLPLAQRRAEVAAEEAKAYHLNARANFWDALGAFIEKLVN